MRKLKLQVQMTLDGYISGANGESDWMTFNWSNDIKKYVDEITQPVDLILLGKHLATGFIPHWEAVAQDDNNPEKEAGIKYHKTPKIVFSRTLKKLAWENTVIENGDFITKIQALKQQPGNDIIVYGGGQFVSSLIKEQLIDEFHLFINPAIIGKGMPIFQQVNKMQQIEISKTIQFDCGIVLLKYQLRK
jgi:dihydrofolate reductase